MAVTLHLAITALATATDTNVTTIEVQTASFDGVQTLNIGSQTSGAGAGKVTFNPFSVTRSPDANSAILWGHMCSGMVIKSMVLTATRGGSTTPFCSFTMGLVAVKTIAVAAAENGDVVETVAFEYGQATYGAATQDATGKLGSIQTAGWDITKNLKI